MSKAVCIHSGSFFNASRISCDFLVRQFRLFGGFVPPQLEAHQRVCVGMAEPHRFAHNHGKELQFHDGRVAPDRLAGLFLVVCAPFDVFKGVAVGNGAGRMVMLFLQPERQPDQVPV